MTQNPYVPPKTQLQVDVSALKETDFVKAFAAFAICALIAGVVVGAVIGGLVGAVWGMSASPAAPGFRATISVFSGIAVLFINYFVFRFFVVQFIVVKLVPELKGAA